MCIYLVIGTRWLITLGKDGGELTMGIRNFNLLNSHVRKGGKINLKSGFYVFAVFTPPK